MGSDTWFRFARATSAALVLSSLLSCATEPRHETVRTIDVASVESSTILTSETIEKFDLYEHCCDGEIEFDGSSSDRAHPAWQDEVVETETLLGAPVPSKECKAGTPDTYAFVKTTGTAWSAAQDVLLARAPDGSKPAFVMRVAHRYKREDQRLRRELSAQEWQALAGAMSELRVREFPLGVPASGFACIHANAAAFESCIDGQYRASYDTCAIRYSIDHARAGNPNEFVRTELLLQDFFAEPPPKD